MRNLAVSHPVQTYGVSIGAIVYHASISTLYVTGIRKGFLYPRREWIYNTMLHVLGFIGFGIHFFMCVLGS